MEKKNIALIAKIGGNVSTNIMMRGFNMYTLIKKIERERIVLEDCEV